ncbi:MAG: hypothetical protein Q9164_003317 [Protoblastenia rupestris]
MTPTHPVPTPPVIHNYGFNQKPPVPNRPFSDPNLLAPEDAFHAHSSTRRQQQVTEHYSELDGDVVTTDIPNLRGGAGTRRKRGRDRQRDGSRRGKKTWKKLLWVKQKDCWYTDVLANHPKTKNPSRSRQLHRPSNVPFPPATKSSPPSL